MLRDGKLLLRSEPAVRSSSSTLQYDRPDRRESAGSKLEGGGGEIKMHKSFLKILRFAPDVRVLFSLPKNLHLTNKVTVVIQIR